MDGLRDAPPPALTFYVHTRDFGDPYGGWLKWPPVVFAETLMARNVYNAWRDYTNAKNRVKWLNEHGNSGARIVGLVKEYRYGQAEQPMTALERWESWQHG